MLFSIASKINLVLCYLIKYFSLSYRLRPFITVHNPRQIILYIICNNWNPFDGNLISCNWRPLQSALSARSTKGTQRQKFTNCLSSVSTQMFIALAFGLPCNSCRIFYVAWRVVFCWKFLLLLHNAIYNWLWWLCGK